MGLHKYLLIGALIAMPLTAASADEPVLPKDDPAEAAAVSAEEFDALATGTVDSVPAGEAEESWMSPAGGDMGGCHRSRKQQTVYYTN